MKKVICAILLAATCLLLVACSYKPKYVPRGYTGCEEHYEEDSIQDYTDFCLYRYDSADYFTNNKAYSKIGEADIETVKEFFEDFKGVMESQERLDEYKFDTASISSGDYVRIETKEADFGGETPFDNYVSYDVYFFDVETLTLYYIHDNI